MTILEAIENLKKAEKDMLKAYIESENKAACMKVVKCAEVQIDEISYINELKTIYFNKWRVVL